MQAALRRRGPAEQPDARIGVLRRSFLVDSGAQVTAAPYRDVAEMGYHIQGSKVVNLRSIDGSDIPHYGSVKMKARKGDDVMQVVAEVADVDFLVLSTDAAPLRRERDCVEQPCFGVLLGL